MLNTLLEFVIFKENLSHSTFCSLMIFHYKSCIEDILIVIEGAFEDIGLVAMLFGQYVSFWELMGSDLMSCRKDHL